LRKAIGVFLKNRFLCGAVFFIFIFYMEEITITRELLYEKVWVTPLTQLAKEFKISDVGLRKKCLKRNIPLPQVGYWSKIKHGKKIKKIPLPKDQDQTPITLYIKDDNGRPFDPTVDDRIRIKNEIATIFKAHLEPTLKLTKPHHLVKAAKIHLREKKSSYDGQVSSDFNQYLAISASKPLLSLALKIWNSFIRLTEARGHQVKVGNHSTIVVIDDIEIKIDLRERQKRMIDESMSTHYTYHKYVPSGIMCFRMDNFDKREWDNSKKSIESQFPSIFAKFETYAAERKRWKLEAEKNRIRQENEKKIRLEQYQSKLNEFKKVEKLIENSNRWTQAENIRRYACYLESIGKEKEEVEWARNKADWVDPTTEKEDIILGEYSIVPPKNPSNL